MLPLARLKNFVPLLSWVDRCPSVGLMIDAQSIASVGLPEEGAQKNGSHWHSRFILPRSLTDYTNAHQFQTEIAQCVDAVARQYPSRAVRLRIGLPDPLFTLRRIILTEPIKTHQALQAYARWTLAQELGTNAAALSVSYQILSVGEEDNQTLLITAVEQRFIDWLKAAFSQTGCLLDQVDMHSRYLFNQYHAHFSHNHQTGVLVNIQTHSYAFMIWDEWGQPVYFNGHWHKNSGQADETEQAAQNNDDEQVIVDQVAVRLEQVVKSYLAANDSHHVENVYVTGEASLRNLLAQTIDSRTQQSSMIMQTDLSAIWPIGQAAPRIPGIELATVVALS